jgi:hypothetical protein
MCLLAKNALFPNIGPTVRGRRAGGEPSEGPLARMGRSCDRAFAFRINFVGQAWDSICSNEG